MKRFVLNLFLVSLSAFPLSAADLPAVASSITLTGKLEIVATFNESMPTGVTVSRTGRIFVNYPRWGDPVPFTVAEVRDGNAAPFPNAEINKLDTNRAAQTFVSVQSVVVDPRDRLWVLDTGSIKMQPAVPKGPKLVGINLADNRVFKMIQFSPEVVLPGTYLNDVRFDLTKGQDGVAYITDSSDKGANGIIVVDLATATSWRRLHNHASTKAEPQFVPVVEGKPLMRREAGRPAENIRIGSDGIAISADGTRLYYCPLASRRLYSVSTVALLDRTLSDTQVAAAVKDEGEKTASDGLETDAQGRFYFTDYERNAIYRRSAYGIETVAQDPRMLWPDTMSLASNGYLYFTANQLHRQPSFQEGKDLRVKPYYLFRVNVGATPVLLDTAERQVVRERQ